ncbi:hypothetical protein QLX08_001483 [Tetragonisca angustula]|uniref:PH domain-containing protein n=1 Tax=Tetragonisca angustula TaxID=166442 RepID=A0AAW1AIJ3_9HYME
MDPFTQRMLERARARREKLDTQLSNAGHDIKKRRSPLKDANTILAQVAASKTKTPTKSPVKVSTENTSSGKSPRKSISKNVTNENNQNTNKENGNIGLCNVKSKLQRLGELYSDDSSKQLSSPIHRTEEKFNAEEEVIEQKSSKRGARLDRLAALASTINNWEDDLSHPTLAKPLNSKADRIQAKLNEQVKSIPEPQPSTSGYNKGNRYSKGTNSKKEQSSTKQLKWDKTILETLEAQGFSRTQSDSRLVYDYKTCSQRKDEGSLNSPPKHLRQNQQTVTVICEEKQDKKENLSKHIDNKNSNTPEKTSRNITPNTNNNRLTPRFGYNGSPKSPAQSSPGSVLSKASLFESKNTETKAKEKDPTQMTLSERMALFEKNKGEAPLLPKAPLAMSIPPKKLQEKDNSSTLHPNSRAKERLKTDIPNNAVNVQREKFEQGLNVQELENNILHNTYLERQRELDVLRSRFNRNKEMVQAAAGSCIRTSESSEGKSNSPKNSPVCPVKPTPAPDHSAPPPPPPPPQSQISREKSILNQNKNSPIKRQVVSSSTKTTQQTKAAFDIKRIRVAPPKPGYIYPNLSEIENSAETETDTEYTVNSTEAETATLDDETATETETATEAEYYVQDNESEADSEEETGNMNTSLGSILRVVNEQSFLNKKRSIDPDPDSTTSDISVLDEMDEYLDECLASQDGYNENSYIEEGPTPPKLNKAGKNPSTTLISFKHNEGSSYRSPIKKVFPTSPKKEDPYIVDGENCEPLLRSVSFYRRQQSQTPKTPVRIISRTKESTNPISDTTKLDTKSEAILVKEKVKQLLDEVCKQQTIIGQASQALNLCTSTVEFNGSREQVEGERLLLVATHRRQAALNEIQRLKVEGSLKPVTPGSPEVQESGSLTVSAITLPLKRDHFRNMGISTCLHFVCLMRHLEEIVATPIVIAEPGDSCLRFPSTLKLNDLYSDFKITIEIYSLQTQPELLPHEIKYHINSGNTCGNNNSNSNKKLANKTPKKFLKQESRLVMPNVQSPAGPSAVRSPAFQLSGYVIFSLKEIHRQQFTLNKVPLECPLEGQLQMHVSCELSVAVEHRGFLTMFEDVSGFGAWHRRWCLLKGPTLSYWKYPDDERKKAPIGSLDLQNVTTTNVGLISRDICARPNTILLETTKASEPEDVDSLVMIRNGPTTTIRYLLSADTKEDRLEWCSKLNKTLHLIHTWSGPLALS